MLDRFGTATEPALHRRIAWSLMSRGVLLARLDRGIGALTCYDEVVRRFGDSTDTELQELVAQALMRSGYLLSERGDYQRAIEAADALRARPEAGNPEWRAPVAWATLNKGLALYELRRNPEAIAAYDEVIAFATDSDEPDAAGWLACALFHKGLCLTRSGRPDEGAAAYDALITRFAYDPSPEVGYYLSARAGRPQRARSGRERPRDRGEIVEEPPLGGRAGERPETDALAVEPQQVREAMRPSASDRCAGASQLTRCCVAS